jgi:hypothetical protein
MSYDEQKAATAPAIQAIKDEREVKVLAKHNIPISAFHDIKKTLEGIENQASFYTLYFLRSHLISHLGFVSACTNIY